MKVSCIFTLNELKKITPSLNIEHFKSDNPKVKEALKKLFWNLGCTLPDKIEIDEGLVTLNRFGCIDDSPRRRPERGGRGWAWAGRSRGSPGKDSPRRTGWRYGSCGG